MDAFTFNALEFNKILNHLSSFCRSEAGKKEALLLRPSHDFDFILRLQKIYDEYCTWKSMGDFNLIDFPDISPFLAQIHSHKFHPEAEVFWAFREALKLSRNAVLSINNHEEQLPSLLENVNFPFPEKSLSALTRCIADDASFKDESSPALLLIRNEIRSLHQSCLRKVKDYTEQYNIAHYLQDDYMTIVGDRYVLPLKANFKGRLQGIIHDYSKTGETLYFEPMFVVELNNQLQNLKQQEREEEYKIIKFLTELIIQEFNSIELAWKFLLELDLNEAKLGLARAYYPVKKVQKNNKNFARNHISNLSAEQKRNEEKELREKAIDPEGHCVPLNTHLSLINAKHPLLLLENNKNNKSIEIQGIDLIFRKDNTNTDPEKFAKGFDDKFTDTFESSFENSFGENPQKNDFQPNEYVQNDKILVISGGNAGGKTVALKTLGLITMMTLCALPVPVARGSCIIPWTHIHAFIGDEQSLDDHVSTFTGQIRHLAQIWDTLDDKHLVLLDEFGAGTDPSQGAALAQAVLDGILEKNSYAVSATHFPALKTYALTKKGVRAASVLFDSTTKKPLFHLAYDQVGASQALDVAKEHGLCEDILKKASHYLLMDNEDSDIIMNKLNSLSVEREKQLSRLKVEIEKTKEKRQALQERYENEKQRLEVELRSKSQELMHAWKKEKITTKQAMKEIAELRAKVAAEKVKKENTPTQQNFTEKLSVGMEILHKPWQKKAHIQELDVKNHRVKINLGGISMWAALNDIALNADNQTSFSESSAKSLTNTEKVSNKNRTHFARPNISYSLDLRGMRADLALEELAQFLDKAILADPEQVEIIHGRGTGALRKTVHQYLKNYKGITSYSLANEDQGGDGMTLVYFS